MEYIDTNIIIRYLTKDDPEKAKRAFALFQAVDQGTQAIAITEAVIAEVIYVLSSKRLYNLSRAEITKRFLPILLLKGASIGCKPADKPIYAQALHLYATTGLDFTDTLILAKMRQAGIRVVYSFDTGFDRFPDIVRKEPEVGAI
jgi:predicted nucleic acid-binding protein